MLKVNYSQQAVLCWENWTSTEAAANNMQSTVQPFKSHVPAEHTGHLIPTPKG